MTDTSKPDTRFFHQRYTIDIVSANVAHDDQDLSVINYDITTAGTGFYGIVTKIGQKLLPPRTAAARLAEMGFNPSVLNIQAPARTKTPIDPDIQLLAQCGIDPTANILDEDPYGQD